MLQTVAHEVLALLREPGTGGRRWGRRLLGLGALGLLGVSAATPARAQGRGELQVTARVVSAGPSRLATSAALDPASSARGNPLFRITRRLRLGVTRDARPERAAAVVVMVEFLAN